MEGVHPTFILVLALAGGVLAQSVARRVRLPGIVLLLAVGAALGPDGLAWVRPRALGEGLFAVVDLAVAVILFEGGLNLEISRLRRAQASIQRLVTWGALVTLVGAALAIHWILGVGWVVSVLFGSLVVVTGPTVIGPLVSELRLKPRVATVLNAEGVLIDPIGAILAVLVLEVVLSPEPGQMFGGARDMVLRLGFGAVTGVAAGFLLARLLRTHRLLPEGHENIFVLASVLLLFSGCEQVVSHSGILAVTLAGVVVGNRGGPADRDLREFKDQLSIMLIGLLFVLLAADVRVDHVRELGWNGLMVVAALVLVVRPICVAVSTLGSDLTFRERAFIAWLAPRGIVAAAVASLVAGSLESQGLEGGTMLRAMVFLTIACTVTLAGVTSPLVGRWLGVRLPGRDMVALLSAEGVGLAMGRELREGGRSVIFLDSNPQYCRQAEEAGFSVVFGNAMDERILRRARFELVGMTIALTPNQAINTAFVRRTRELFRVPRSYLAVARMETGMASELEERKEAHVAFDGPHDLARWNVRFRRGEVAVEHFDYQPPPEPKDAAAEANGGAPTSGERFLILTVARGRERVPMSRDWNPRAGDRVAVAIHEPDRAEAEAALARLGYQRAEEPETEPADAEVDEAPAVA